VVGKWKLSKAIRVTRMVLGVLGRAEEVCAW